MTESTHNIRIYSEPIICICQITTVIVRANVNGNSDTKAKFCENFETATNGERTYAAAELNDFAEELISTKFTGKSQRAQAAVIARLDVGFLHGMLHRVREHRLH